MSHKEESETDIILGPPWSGIVLVLVVAGLILLGRRELNRGSGF